MSDDQDVPAWHIWETEVFEADRDAAYLYLQRTRGLEYADRWLRGLITAIRDLMEFPGPRANPLDEEESARRGEEVRRLLYFTARLDAAAQRVIVCFTSFAIHNLARSREIF